MILNLKSKIYFFIQKKKVAYLLTIIKKSYKDFINNNATFSASALTFFSILSIVPLMGVGFGIAKGFGYKKYLQEKLYNIFPNHPEVISELLVFAENIIDKTDGGIVSILGLILLFYSVYSMLSNIENVFNKIWGVSKSRNFVRKISDYFSIILLTPIIIIVSNGITTYLTNNSELILKNIHFIPYIETIIFFLFTSIPYLLVGVMISFIYTIIPNTRVNIKYALIVGVITGICYYSVQWIFISLQIGVSRHNAIYGSFSAVPLFFIWIQISWTLIISGAIVCYNVQHQSKNIETSSEKKLGFKTTKILCLSILKKISFNFSKNLEPLSKTELYKHLKNVDKENLNYAINLLIASKIVLPYYEEKTKLTKLLLAKSIDYLTIQNINEELEKINSDTSIENTVDNNIIKKIKEVEKGITKANDIKLKDL